MAAIRLTVGKLWNILAGLDKQVPLVVESPDGEELYLVTTAEKGRHVFNQKMGRVRGEDVLYLFTREISEWGDE